MNPRCNWLASCTYYCGLSSKQEKHRTDCPVFLHNFNGYSKICEFLAGGPASIHGQNNAIDVTGIFTSKE